MPQAKCARCQQWIFSDETIAVEGRDIFHMDCRRPHALTHEERVLLFRYCWDHPVARCEQCALSFLQEQLACARLPAQVREQAAAAREAARRLVKRSRELADQADVLMREAEAATAALRETMRRTTG